MLVMVVECFWGVWKGCESYRMLLNVVGGW